MTINLQVSRIITNKCGFYRRERKEGKVKKEVRSKRYPHALRSKPLYHNCYLEAPDGEMLCTCDNKKAMWYVVDIIPDFR